MGRALLLVWLLFGCSTRGAPEDELTHVAAAPQVEHSAGFVLAGGNVFGVGQTNCASMAAESSRSA
jgi:hypothetical protein